jgi:hypothetical protein
MWFCLSLLKVHGFSLPMWHQYVDNSPATEVLAGTPRSIRSDDWLVTIPFLVAQTAHDPPFPSVNTNIGLGQQMNVIPLMPVANAIWLFRPTSWGFAFGADFGLSSLWWGRWLGLVGTWSLVFLLISGGRLVLSAGAAAILVCSSFHQNWSLNSAEPELFAGWIILSLTILLFAKARRTILLAGAFLGWSAACFAIHLYPPYQVALTYVIASAVLPFFAVNRVWNAAKENWQTRLMGLGIAIVLAAAGVGYFTYAAWDAIELMRNTTYPGQRFVVGGHFRDFWHLYLDNTIPEWVPHKGGPRFQYASRDGFLLIYPVFAALILIDTLRFRRFRFSLSAGALALLMFFETWVRIGFAPVLAKISLLSVITPGREVIALGFGNALLMVCFCTEVTRLRLHRDRFFQLTAVALALIFLFGCHYYNLDTLLQLGKHRANLLMSFCLLAMCVGIIVRYAEAGVVGLGVIAAATTSPPTQLAPRS